MPKSTVAGLDISSYAIKKSHPDIKKNLKIGSAIKLPWKKITDLVVSFNTLHNLYNFELDKALKEISRVSKKHSYICVDLTGMKKKK